MDSLIIFLHGVGGRGDDLAPLGEYWSQALPATVFAAPDAPFPFDQGGSGRQWFSISGVTPENRAQRIVDARQAFDKTLQTIMTAKGFSDKPHRVALVGFSQGAIMSLDALVTGRWSLGAVVAFSGRLASPKPFTPSLSTPALLVHGSSDPVIAPSESQKAHQQLSEIGVSSTCHILPGVGHTISAEGAALAINFLRQTLHLG
ncbi:alpha/beta hydrolase [Brucella gallinifaecis]|uniref:alpha/beta hydrolase n=1 Tax=Brucella gallinifaecis TaxID=215590 RepID=UPI00235FB537|nr:dienelactone hydrolase family protein [Brucella gallinifaecis]